MKHYLFILSLLCLTGCGKEPTKVQLETVDRLIQQQIDIPYKEHNWESAKEQFLKNGETVKQASARHKKLYSDINNYLVDLKNKPYKDKRDWAVKMLTMELDLLEKSLDSFKEQGKLDISAEARKELATRIEQKQQWLAILKE